MYRELVDIAKHVGVFGNIEGVKVTGSSTSTTMDAMDDQQTFVIKAKFKNPIPSFEGIFGIGQFSLLNGILNIKNYKKDTARITIKKHESFGVPESIIFVDEEGQQDIFRLKDKGFVKTPGTFNEPNYDIEFNPSKEKIKEFSDLSALYGSFESNFMPTVVDGHLRFYVGYEESANHNGFRIIERDVVGKLKAGLCWPIALVLSILKLADNDKVTMSIGDKNLKITIETELAVYNYILPAKRTV